MEENKQFNQYIHILDSHKICVHYLLLDFKIIISTYI